MNTYTIVYFSPNPVVDWKIPVGFMMPDVGFAWLTDETIPYQMNTKAKNLLFSVLPFDNKVTTLNFSSIPFSAGPHFSVGPTYPFPSKVEDKIGWLRGMFR